MQARDIEKTSGRGVFWGAYQGGHATTIQFLEGLLEGSLKEVLLRRVLRTHLVRASVGTGVLRRVLRRGGVIEGAQKSETRPFAEYDPLCVHPIFVITL